ncbi:hypothetical protein RBH26_12185 [Natronolimnohabitans sp. A-GB9]|uniref:hypothetical protein n=1 Tax=Natronolimnohabitans sp. A-GB9 TaxID=3069757 RepID=UPI0027AF2FDB|nr:hypothetical protein [Natronolimnohabitans sp. A-GB9]MDQ2051237.1 hypothetical protein [Natronolimnohabitans sp. A-GB9]
MKRPLGSVIMLALLLPGVWLADGQTLTIPVPTELPIETAGAIDVGVPELLFAGIPTLFVCAMFLEALGHVRERQPPS